MTTRPAQARAHAQLLRARPKNSRHDVMRAAEMLDDLARQLEAPMGRRVSGGWIGPAAEPTREVVQHGSGEYKPRRGYPDLIGAGYSEAELERRIGEGETLEELLEEAEREGFL